MRREDLEQTVNQALAFALSNLHTVVLCKVESVEEKTINCKPVTNRVVNGESRELPLFTKVPPIFLSGGSSYKAYPISKGDYCLLMITERCFDSWNEGSDYVAPLEKRMHDYSDGFALVGIKNKAGAITIPDVITQIGDMFAQGNWEHEGNLTRTGDETLIGDRNQTGDEKVTGEIESTVKVSAPILSGVLTGVGGAAPVIPQSITAAELHAQNGFTGTKVADGVSFVFVDGILIS